MKRNFLMAVGIVISIASTAFGQSPNYVDVSIEITPDLVMAEVGTYQFIVHDSKGTPAFTTEILYFVERERTQSKDLVLRISEHVDLYIPCRDKINSEQFTPLTEISF